MPHTIYWIILVICWGGLGLSWAIGWVYNLWKALAVQTCTATHPWETAFHKTVVKTSS